MGEENPTHFDQPATSGPGQEIHESNEVSGLPEAVTDVVPESTMPPRLRLVPPLAETVSDSPLETPESQTGSADSKGGWDDPQKASAVASVIASQFHNELRDLPDDAPLVNDSEVETSSQWAARRMKNVFDNRKVSAAIVLYDTNPERFAAMPAKEFVAITRTFEGIASKLAGFYEKRDALVDNVDLVKDSLAKARPIQDELSLFLVFKRDVLSVLGNGNEEHDRDIEQFLGRGQRDYYADSFDKSPRQRMETLADFMSQIIDGVETRINEIRAQYDEIVGFPKPKAVPDLPASKSKRVLDLVPPAQLSN